MIALATLTDSRREGWIIDLRVTDLPAREWLKVEWTGPGLTMADEWAETSADGVLTAGFLVTEAGEWSARVVNPGTWVALATAVHRVGA